MNRIKIYEGSFFMLISLESDLGANEKWAGCGVYNVIYPELGVRIAERTYFRIETGVAGYGEQVIGAYVGSQIRNAFYVEPVPQWNVFATKERTIFQVMIWQR